VFRVLAQSADVDQFADPRREDRAR
jgi:hypothetical protein